MSGLVTIGSAEHESSRLLHPELSPEVGDGSNREGGVS
jgi:hypothetical protein